MASLTNRGSKVWKITIFLGKEDGKQKRYYETISGYTKPQATMYAHNLEAKFKIRLGSSKCNIKTVEQLLTKWLHDIEKRIEKSTFQQYKRNVNKLDVLLGDLQLFTLDSIIISERLEQLDEGSLSPRTIKNYYRTLVTAMNWGADRKYVARDVMDGIKPPMIQHVTRDIFKVNELSHFIETAKGFKHYLPLRILAITGLRIGELMGLKWRNVSNEGNIKIVEAVNSRLGYLKDTKTKNSRRELALDDETAKELQEHKKLLAKENNAKDNDFVFQSDDGASLRYQVIFNTKNRILKKAGLHHIRLHDLRHGVGSIMLDSGASITSVAEQLGQVPATTAGIYSHALRKGSTIADLIVVKAGSSSIENATW